MTTRREEVIDDDLLLKMFNCRDHSAFGAIYLHLYDELHYFARKLFQGVTITTEDVIQDIFINIWENKSLRFDTIDGIKAYLYVAIRNKRIKFINHTKCVNKHIQSIKEQEDELILSVAENEVMSFLSRSMTLIPEECAKVFKLCLEGWEMKEIAAKLEKSESTVYKQRNEAIRILRKKLPHKELLFLLILLETI